MEHNIGLYTFYCCESLIVVSAGQPVNEALLRKKDANIKKNSSFVKKLVSLTVGATLA